MRGLFVTGTDTGVGKSVLAAAVCAALAARGERVAAFKPAVTGLGEPVDDEWAPDHELLAATANAGQPPAAVAPFRFAAPASPHLAARRAGVEIDARRLVRMARAAGEGADALVCEGVGGLLVPLAPAYLVRDLAAELGLPLLVAARPGLGTINHTLLTVEAARAAGLRVAAVVLTPWPRAPGPVERSNRETIERLAGVPVGALAETHPRGLAAAGSSLDLDAWIGAPHVAVAARRAAGAGRPDRAAG